MKKWLLSIVRFFERIHDAQQDRVSESWLKEHRYTAQDPNPKAETRYEQC